MCFSIWSKAIVHCKVPPPGVCSLCMCARALCTPYSDRARTGVHWASRRNSRTCPNRAIRTQLSFSYLEEAGNKEVHNSLFCISQGNIEGFNCCRISYHIVSHRCHASSHRQPLDVWSVGWVIVLHLVFSSFILIEKAAWLMFNTQINFHY